MDQLDTALRLLAATATGVAIGFTRDLEGKPLGARTLGSVGMAAALVALTVVQMPVIAQSPDAPSRAIQGVVVGVLTGIGFLGSGVILRHPERGTVQISRLPRARGRLRRWGLPARWGLAVVPGSCCADAYASIAGKSLRAPPRQAEAKALADFSRPDKRRTTVSVSLICHASTPRNVRLSP